ncbi:hypothetical protein ABTY59_28935 [Streptomyces sp. NPDC096079]|uniref:hypothetical protein n=1 Tax=Streptomyces sp. NPDC096079 TaxID=3155820 RepID=UPI00332BAF7F
MSASYERSTLAPSLASHVRGLRGATVPHGGHPLPGTARTPRPRGPGPRHREACARVTDALDGLLSTGTADPEPALVATGIRDRTVFRAAATFDRPDAPAARALGRRLVRTGATLVGVACGLGLLSRYGEPEDVPYLRELGLLDGLASAAVEALTPLDPQAAATVALAHRARGTELRALVDALVSGRTDELRDLVVAVPAHRSQDVGPDQARLIAEATRLPALLRAHPDDAELLARAEFLLARTTSRRDYTTAVARYAEARELYEAITARVAAGGPATGLDRRARLLTLALDLHSGASHLLDWPSGRREEVLGVLLDAVGQPARPEAEDDGDPWTRRRADWLHRTAPRLRAATTPVRPPTAPNPAPVGQGPAPVEPGPAPRPPAPVGQGPAPVEPGPAPMEPARAPRLRVEVAVADPGDPDVVETRFLVDGRPLVPWAFGRGPGDPPERLLDTGVLRARDEPREVRLAEAYCTEGCCGALHVTVRREGPHVVWDGWSRPGAPRGLPDPPALRFDAAAYDAEIGRAERDRGWSWPARDTARLIARGLRDRPGLLARWGLRPGWVSTDFSAPDTTVITYNDPPRTSDGAPWPRQYLWLLPDDGTPPERRAADALRRFETEDPRGYPEPSG